MIEYVIPLTSLLLTFLSALASLRFIFSRQGFYWILPLLVSLILCTSNLYFLINPAILSASAPFGIIFFPLALALVWYLMIIVFHYALKKDIDRNRYLNDQKKNYEEARFLEKAERREFLRLTHRRKENAEGSAYEPKLDDED